MALPAHPQPPLSHWVRGTRGQQFQRHPAVDPYNFTLRVFGGVIAFYVRRRRWAATCANPKPGHCFLTRFGKSCAGRPLGLMLHGLRNCSQGLQQEHVYALAAPNDAGVSARWALVSELGGPNLAALQLPLENPHEVELV